MVPGVNYSPPGSIRDKSVDRGGGGWPGVPGSCRGLERFSLRFLMPLPPSPPACCSQPAFCPEPGLPPTVSCDCQGEEEVAVLCQVVMKNASLWD